MAIICARGVGSDGGDENYLKLKLENNEEYTNIVAHACRVAVELGADIIKTNFTGSTESFERVVYAAGNTPVIIAGGERVGEDGALENVRQAMKAGASGICFGRNLFYRDNILSFIEKVWTIIYE
jgi:DhnA family fructose-bisphosphate aldolase class Ia